MTESYYLTPLTCRTTSVPDETTQSSDSGCRFTAFWKSLLSFGFSWGGLGDAPFASGAATDLAFSLVVRCNLNFLCDLLDRLINILR